MENKKKLLIQALGAERLRLDEPLKNHVFTGIGGAADLFYTATLLRELVEVLDTAYQLKIKFLIIGNGTKMLIPKNGLRGLAVKNRTGNIKIGGIKGKVKPTGIGVEEALVEVDSGVSIDKLNVFLKKQNLKPLVALSVRSTIGGALFLDPVFKDLVLKIRVWEEGQVDDIILENLHKSQVILSVVLKIKTIGD